MTQLKYKNPTGNNWVDLFPLSIENGGTGAITASGIRDAFKYLQNLGTNITEGEVNDTQDFWRDQEPGIYWFEGDGQIKSQPTPYGFLIHLKYSQFGPLCMQVWVGYGSSLLNNGLLYVRTINKNDEVNVFTQWVKHTTWQDIYPVGAVYFSYSSTSPADIFGGQWTQITSRYLRAANDVKTGGTDTVSHQHMQTVGTDDNSGNLYSVAYNHASGKTLNGTNGDLVPKSQTFNGVSEVRTFTRAEFTSRVGNVSAAGRFDATSLATVSNMPSYQDLYVWRRTS